jgi:hypothetical protein
VRGVRGVAHQGLLLLGDDLALLSLLVEGLREPRDLFLLRPDLVFEARDLELLVLHLEVLLQQRPVEQFLLLITSTRATTPRTPG